MVKFDGGEFIMLNKKILVLVFIVLFNVSLVAQQGNKDKSTTQIAGLYFPKESTKQELKLVLVEDFENCDSWTAKMPSDQGYARVKKVLGAPKAVKDKYPKNSKYVLGLKEWSYTRGFNWCEIKPPRPIEMVGNLKGLSIWALGRNYRHKLEIWVKNYQGIEYPIEMGSLNFKGWRQLSARIPMYIPYYTKYVPQFKKLAITKIIVRHDPNEINGVFYLYLDNMEAIVDVYDDKYDGDDMLNENGIERFEEILTPKKSNNNNNQK